MMDWKKIRKEYKKLKSPKDFWDPSTLSLGECKYHIELSDRSRGETVNDQLLLETYAAAFREDL